MASKNESIDALLDADKRFIEGWTELRLIGSNDYCEDLLAFMSLNETPTILKLFERIRKSNKSNTQKIFALEALAANLSDIAIDLGFIKLENKDVKHNN